MLFNLSIVNESTNQRLSFYKGAISSFIDSFPFGIGIGNWKVESILYYNEFIQSYIVPYHAHNDFLEFSTELGVLGGLTYFGLFILVIFKSFTSYMKSKDFKFLILFLSFIALFVDSSLNFPFERPLIQIMFLSLLALNIHYDYSHDS